MDTNKSIRVLQEQLSELLKITTKPIDYIAWHAHTTDLVIEIFGKENFQVKRFAEINPNTFNPYQMHEGATKHAAQLLNGMIDILKNKRSTRMKAQEVLSDDDLTKIANKPFVIDKRLFWTLIFGVLTIGGILGNAKFDNDKRNLDEDNRTLKTENEKLKERIAKDSAKLVFEDSLNREKDKIIKGWNELNKKIPDSLK